MAFFFPHGTLLCIKREKKVSLLLFFTVTKKKKTQQDESAKENPGSLLHGIRAAGQKSGLSKGEGKKAKRRIVLPLYYTRFFEKRGRFIMN